MASPLPVYSILGSTWRPHAQVGTFRFLCLPHATAANTIPMSTVPANNSVIHAGAMLAGGNPPGFWSERDIASLATANGTAGSAVTGSARAAAKDGTTPKTMQGAASRSIPASIDQWGSFALAAWSLRGKARKVMLNAFAKHASASAPVSARNATLKPTMTCVATESSVMRLPSNPWKTSHSEANPFKGGKADIAMDPMRKLTATNGILAANPPNFSMFRMPVALWTAPAPRKSRLLNSAWLRVWNKPANSAIPAYSLWPDATNNIADPTPMRMMPMFSTLE